MDRPIRPPMMTAPDPAKPSIKYSPRVSIQRQAEEVVVKAAREVVHDIPRGNSPALDRLRDAVNVLEQIEAGK